MMHVKASSKARTLQRLGQVLKTASFLPSMVFNVSEWRGHRSQTLQRLKVFFVDVPFWIVRSSCLREDSQQASHAGAFLSVPNVQPADAAEAIDRVIASYGAAIDEDEVLVQPMLQNVLRSGVAFTHDPHTCAPYRIISWTEGADTTLVTGGLGGRTWQQAAASKYSPPLPIASVMPLLEELEDVFQGSPVDCEFAITAHAGEERLWLLQARPLVLRRPPELRETQEGRLSIIACQIERGMRPQPFLKGMRTVYGVMPDWNPAEIIGLRPKPLSLSLYRELVTDAIWAYQRHNYGYRNLRSFPLMVHFFGLPYVDVRVSFNSFIPADLESNLASRIVDYYIDRLIAEPHLHDKVEFDIVFSCYSFDLEDRMQDLKVSRFSESDRIVLTDSLRRLTNRVIDTENGLWRRDAERLSVLEKRREQLMSSNEDILSRIYWLLEDAKRYGTLPFAGLARAGFISIQLLRSLVHIGVLSRIDCDRFLSSLSTISGQLTRDRLRLDKHSFLLRYGHLRPGTYDLSSPRYDEAPDTYFDWHVVSEEIKSSDPFSLTLPQMREIDSLLKKHSLTTTPVGLFDFMQAGIELREWAKFCFTRNLSDALSLIGIYGEEMGFSKEDITYCDISIFREIYMGAGRFRDMLARAVESGKARYEETLKVSLPPLITGPEDVWGFEWPSTKPSYITQKQITAPVVGDELTSNLLTGKIVCIPNADPGYDWLFSHSIAGLVTAWGGANSHMAIRAAELGLPAVIGAGEALFRQWKSASRLHIDCAAHKVQIII